MSCPRIQHSPWPGLKPVLLASGTSALSMRSPRNHVQRRKWIFGGMQKIPKLRKLFSIMELQFHVLHIYLIIFYTLYVFCEKKIQNIILTTTLTYNFLDPQNTTKQVISFNLPPSFVPYVCAILHLQIMSLYTCFKYIIK